MTLLRLIFLILPILTVCLAHPPRKCEQSIVSKRFKPPQVDAISPFEKRFRQATKLVNAPIRIHLDSSKLTIRGQEREDVLKIMGKFLTK